MRVRTYSELRRLQTFSERFEYLRLTGEVGNSTFGHSRVLNQGFYKSREWRQVRQKVIGRDYGRDLGCEGYDIHEGIIVHHMNPMLPEDILGGSADILDPEYLITIAHDTHNAVHYGLDEPTLPTFADRKPGDTTLWRN